MSAEFVTIGRGGASQIGHVDVKVDVPTGIADSLQALVEQMHAIRCELEAMGKTDVDASIQDLCAVLSDMHIQIPTPVTHVKVEAPEVKIPPISVDIRPVFMAQKWLLIAAIVLPPIWVSLGIVYLKFG